MFYRTLAVLPALVGAWRDRGGGLARSVGSYHDALVDEGALTRLDLLAGRVPRAHQHEPSRRGAHRPGDGPAGRRAVVWNCNPLVTVPNTELIRAGHGPRRPVHRRPRAVPHRHRPLRRHRAAGDDAARDRPTSCRRGGTCGWAGTRPRSSRSARRAATPSCSAGWPGDGPARIRRCSTTTRRSSSRRSAQKVDLDELRAGRVAARCRTPRTAGPWGAGVFPTPSGRVELVSERLVAMGQPALPTFVPPREGPHGDPDLRARFPLQLMTPKHHTRFLNSGYSPAAQARPGRGRPVRRARPRRRRGPRPRRRRPGRGSGTTGPASPCRCAITERVRPGVVAIPFGWWSAHHPDGRVGQRPHQRHAHRLGRRRGLQRHARGGRASDQRHVGASAQAPGALHGARSPAPLTQAPGVGSAPWPAS